MHCCILSIILAAQLNLSNPTPEDTLSQIITPNPSSQTFIRTLRARNTFLQRQNAELKRIIQNLEPYLELTQILQQQQANAEQELFEMKRRNESLAQDLDEAQNVVNANAQRLQEYQTRLTQDKETISKLTLDQKRGEERIRTAEEQKRLSEQLLTQERTARQSMQEAKKHAEQDLLHTKKLQEQMNLALQFARQRSDELTQERQKLINDCQGARQTLDTYKAQLLTAVQKIEQLEQAQKTTSQQSTEELGALKARFQSIQQENEINRSTLENVQRLNAALTSAKATSDQQYREKSSRLDLIEKAYFKSLEDAKERQATLQSTLDEKSAIIVKWQQAHAQLKSQLDQAISINSELRQQISQLEAQCAAKTK